MFSPDFSSYTAAMQDEFAIAIFLLQKGATKSKSPRGFYQSQSALYTAAQRQSLIEHKILKMHFLLLLHCSARAASLCATYSTVPAGGHTIS